VWLHFAAVLRRLPLTRLLVLLTVATAAAVTYVVVRPGPANAADLYVAPSGAGSACSATQPCGSFDAAYRAAKPGDVVEVGGGTYGKQEVPALDRPAPAIEFRSAQGAAVVVNGLDVRADWITLRGMRSSAYLDVDSGNPADPVEHVQFIDMRAKTHFINGTRDFVWTRGSIGPSHNDKASLIGSQPVSMRLTYDGILWHDATRDDAGVHMECLYVDGVQGLTIRNSRFTNCAVFDVFITRLGDSMPSDIVFENNVFEHSTDVGSNSTAFAAFALHPVVKLNRIVLRNNTWEQGWQQEDGAILSGRVVGNIGQADWTGGCRPELTYSHNVFTKKKCGATDKVVQDAFSQFENPDAGDWRLKPGAAAIDAGDPQDHPPLDAAGNVRPWGGAPDAGAFEFGSQPPGNAGHQVVTRAATRHRARVLRVIDGRTLRVRMKRGGRKTVRLLGITVPGPSRCGGRLAAARLRALAPKGRFVVVITDRRGRTRGARGRTLAYVARSRRDIGKLMISRGWARVAKSDGRISRLGPYRVAQRQAQRLGLGLWRCG
jgi:endonuclease YncB( thermonuclease family)